MEWYIRFKKGSNANKWLKARQYQIKIVEYYINNPELKNQNTIKRDNTIYTTYLNEYGETIEMLFDIPEKIAYINRITDLNF
jgi:hypothetical protein